MLASYDFSSYTNIVDIGGGHGSLLCAILDRYKDLKAVLFDSGHVVEKAGQNFESAGLSERVQIVNGDFFKEIPSGGDLYIMKNVLHDWNDEDGAIILQNVGKAMQPGSKLIVIEAIIKNDNRYSFGKMIDILMLVVTKEGRERTMDEFRLLFGRSGFRIEKVNRTISPFSIIECTKSNV